MPEPVRPRRRASTSCPGEYAHELIPEIRGRIAGTAPIYLAPPVLVDGIEVRCLRDRPGDGVCRQHPRSTHDGREPVDPTLISSDPPPGYIYDEGEDFAAAGFAKIADTYRFGLDFKRTAAQRIPTAGVWRPARAGGGARGRRLRAHEPPPHDNLDRQRGQGVRALYRRPRLPAEDRRGRPADRRQPASGDAGVRYFSETGHNVPGAFARYWEANGGLPRFGYPLTEAFEEVSETDGGRYLTQYFERARFEYHPEYSGTKDEVLLGLLGVELTRGRHNDSGFRP